MKPAFRFPARSGAAQADGLALLQHVIAYGVTPADLDACQLALHVAPLAYLGAPEAHTVAAVNVAVDALSAAVRRLSAAERALEAEKAARRAKLARLFDGFEGTDDGGSRVPVTPPAPTLPPFAAGERPTVDKLEALAVQLAEKTGLTLPQARQLIIDKVRAAGAAKEAA